jgi:DNA repair protein RadA/Sms
MKKQKTVLFRCSACGHEEPKWLGRCPECGEWKHPLRNSRIRSFLRRPRLRFRGLLLPLSSVDPHEGSRIPSGIGELDRVLGGGIMKRSSVLVGGEPGIGKSTLLLQAAASCATKGRILYVSGEESAGQIRMRADRLGISGDRIELFCSGKLEEIERVLEAVKPVLVIVDSVQTLHTPEVGSSPAR